MSLIRLLRRSLQHAYLLLRNASTTVRSLDRSSHCSLQTGGQRFDGPVDRNSKLVFANAPIPTGTIVGRCGVGRNYTFVYGHSRAFCFKPTRSRNNADQCEQYLQISPCWNRGVRYACMTPTDTTGAIKESSVMLQTEKRARGESYYSISGKTVRPSQTARYTNV